MSEYKTYLVSTENGEFEAMITTCYMTEAELLEDIKLSTGHDVTVDTVFDGDFSMREDTLYIRQ